MRPLSLVWGTTMLLGAVPALAANEVSLVHARSIVSNKYGITVQSAQFDVQVAQLGRQQSVSIRHRAADGQWQTTPLTFSRMLGNGQALWSGSLPNYSTNGVPGQPMTLDFVVSYQADGRQYWDDNQRQGYQLAPTAGDVLYGPVVWVTNHTGSLDQFWGGQYHGSVVLKNLGYHKDVQVVYSTDHWQSQRVAYASYSPSYWASAYAHTTNPNPAGFEVWSYVLDVGAATAVEYAVRYQVNGQIYWDDNGGQNHQARLTNRQM